MTQINLLPPEIQTRERTRRRKIAAVGAVGAAIVLVLVVYVLQTARLAAVNRDLEDQQRANATLQSQVGQLQRFETLRQTLLTKQSLVDSLVAGQVAWSGVLRDVSRSLPGNLWLTQLNGTLSVPGGAAPGTTSSGVVGSIQFQGKALHGHATVASWLRRLEQVPGWANPWVTTSSKEDANGGGNGPVQTNFSTSVDLTTEATVDGRPQ